MHFYRFFTRRNLTGGGLRAVSIPATRVAVDGSAYRASRTSAKNFSIGSRRLWRMHGHYVYMRHIVQRTGSRPTMTTLPDFRLESWFSRWEFAARYHLTASDAQSMSLAQLLALAEPADREAFEALHLGYTQTYGAPALREAIASTYQQREAADILCFAGAEEGIYIAMRVLLEPGDHAIVVTPNYQAAETIPLSICEVTGVALNPDDHWSLDIDDVAAAIRPNTRVVSINFPHNPTGKILERERFDALVASVPRTRHLALQRRGVPLPRPLGSTHLPQAADVYEKGLSLGVMSKAYGLPGLRIGWIACADRALLQRMERYKHYLSITQRRTVGGIGLDRTESALDDPGWTSQAHRPQPRHAGRFLRSLARPLPVVSPRWRLHRLSAIPGTGGCRRIRDRPRRTSRRAPAPRFQLPVGTHHHPNRPLPHRLRPRGLRRGDPSSGAIPGEIKDSSRKAGNTTRLRHRFFLRRGRGAAGCHSRSLSPRPAFASCGIAQRTAPDDSLRTTRWVVGRAARGAWTHDFLRWEPTLSAMGTCETLPRRENAKSKSTAVLVRVRTRRKSTNGYLPSPPNIRDKRQGNRPHAFHNTLVTNPEGSRRASPWERFRRRRRPDEDLAIRVTPGGSPASRQNKTRWRSRA